MDLSPLSRRVFIGKLAGAAAVAPALALPYTPLESKTEAPSAARSRFERLHQLLAEARRLAAASFPEFDFCPFPSVPGKEPCDVFGFLIFSRTAPPEPPVIEYNGPGLYEIRLKTWEKEDAQLRRVEKAPRHLRLSGQFRFRLPDARPRSHWHYAPESDVQLIRRA